MTKEEVYRIIIDELSQLVTRNRYAAMDKDGTWCTFGAKPVCINGVWTVLNTNNMHVISISETSIGYANSLFKKTGGKWHLINSTVKYAVNVGMDKVLHATKAKKAQKAVESKPATSKKVTGPLCQLNFSAEISDIVILTDVVLFITRDNNDIITRVLHSSLDVLKILDVQSDNKSPVSIFVVDDMCKASGKAKMLHIVKVDGGFKLSEGCVLPPHININVPLSSEFHYMAMDADSSWYAYIEKPCENEKNNMWDSEVSKDVSCFAFGNDPLGWQHSLHEYIDGAWVRCL